MIGARMAKTCNETYKFWCVINWRADCLSIILSIVFSFKLVWCQWSGRWSLLMGLWRNEKKKSKALGRIPLSLTPLFTHSVILSSPHISQNSSIPTHMNPVTWASDTGLTSSYYRHQHSYRGIIMTKYIISNDYAFKYTGASQLIRMSWKS